MRDSRPRQDRPVLRDAVNIEPIYGGSRESAFLRFLLGSTVPTDAELKSLEEQIIADAESGMSSVVVDGMNVSMAPLKDRLDALDRIKANQITNPFATMRHQRIISPGGGG